MSKRSVLVVAHTGRPEAVRSAQLVIERLSAAGIFRHLSATDARKRLWFAL